MCPPSAHVPSIVHAGSEAADARAHRRGQRHRAAARRLAARDSQSLARIAPDADRGAQPQADGLARLGWQRLLPFLARDAATAPSSRISATGADYERVRAQLLKFFRGRGAWRGEELADETFDRVARQLAADRLGDVRNATGYMLGVARLVWLESVKHDVERRTRLAQWQATRERTSPASPASIDRLIARELDLDALDRCLTELGPEARALLLGYYAHDGRARIETREALVRRFGMNPGRLRVRVHRLRLQLEAKVRALFAEPARNQATRRA